MTDEQMRPAVSGRAAEPAASTTPIPVTPEAAIRRHRRRRRGGLVALVLLALVIGTGVVAYLIGEPIFRANAESQIARTVDENLPPGVTGTAVATINGGSSLLQYLHGSFDDVTITGRNLHVQGASSTAVVHVKGLPVQGGKVGSATATMHIGQAAFTSIPQLKAVGASPLRFGRGTVSTTVTKQFLGIDLRIAVKLVPTLSQQVLHLSPTSATITAGPASVPATAIVQQLLPDGVALCTAKYLPRGITLTSVGVEPSAAVVSLSAKDVDLATLDSTQTGHC